MFRFDNNWMLIALIAASIPIIIEWLFRRRRKRIEFPAMRYLMNPKKRKKIRMQDRILLIVRTVALGLLALALARPVLLPAASATVQARGAIIVLDETYSMGQAFGQTTCFKTAQAMGVDIVRGLAREMPVSVVTLGHKPAVLAWTSHTLNAAKTITTDHGAVEYEIRRQTISDGAGKMADAVEKVEELLKESPGQATDVYLISDMQRATWEPEKDPKGRDVKAMLDKLCQSCEVFVLDAGDKSMINGNAYITRFEPAERVMAVRLDNTFEVDIKAVNMDPKGKLTVSLFTDEDRTAATAPEDLRKRSGYIRTIDLNVADLRAGEATVTFVHKFDKPGEHLLRVELEGDGLTSDNQRFYLATVPDKVKVLVLDPKFDAAEKADPLDSNSGFLRSAIGPLTPGIEPLSRFAIDTHRPEDLYQLNLDHFAVIILTNVGDLEESFVARLEQYVADGGKLLIFAGDKVTAYEYNSKLNRKGRELLPCKLSDPVGLPVLEGLSLATTRPADETLVQRLAYTAGGSAAHESVANVRPMTKAASVPCVGRYLPCEIRGLASPVAYIGQTPVICTQSYGQGKVAFVATSADASWNFMVYTGEYTVLLQELLRWLVGDPDRPVNLAMGDTFVQPVLLSQDYLVLRRPDFDAVRLVPKERGGEAAADAPVSKVWEVTYPDADSPDSETDQQGVYRVDTTEEFMARRRFVVNMKATEGDLSRMDTDTLGSHLNRSGNLWTADTPVESTVLSRHSVREYAGMVLWAIFALLAVETYLATRFGRRRI